LLLLFHLWLLCDVMFRLWFDMTDSVNVFGAQGKKNIRN
jgi:hypothetical protein